MHSTVFLIIQHGAKTISGDIRIRIYSMRYSDYDIKFMYNKTGITVTDIIKLNGSEK